MHEVIQAMNELLQEAGSTEKELARDEVIQCARRLVQCYEVLHSPKGGDTFGISVDPDTFHSLVNALRTLNQA